MGMGRDIGVRYRNTGHNTKHTATLHGRGTGFDTVSEDMGVKECDVMDPYPVRTEGEGSDVDGQGPIRQVFAEDGVRAGMCPVDMIPPKTRPDIRPS